MDHFMGGFSTKLGSLLNLRSYEILGPPKEVAPGRLELDVRVVDGKGDDAGRWGLVSGMVVGCRGAGSSLVARLACWSI